MTDNGETLAAQSETEADNWRMVVDLIQLAFREVKLAEEATWQALVLLTKVKTEYRFIGLVEVIWKVVAEILNLRLTASVSFHEFLHGFREGRVTGTATLEAKRLPGGGVTGPSGNEDENSGALPAPACPRHHGDSGGGKLPPPTVRPM